MRAFYPVILILLVLVSGCVQQETGDECQSFDVDECPNDCVVCPPCEECSSITCQTEEFCNSIGFDRDWSNRVNGDMSDNGSDHVPEGTTDSDSVQEEEMGPPTIYGIGINLEPYNPETGFAGDVSFDGLTYENRLFIEFGASMNDGGLNVHPMFVIPRGTKIRAVSSGIVSVYKLHLDDDYDVHVKRTINDRWFVSYEHVTNITVSDGDVVELGQIIGDAGEINDFTESGKFDLKMTRGSNSADEEILDYCPYALLDDSVKEELHSEILTFISDWEEFIGEDVYDEDSWYSPGCAYEKFNEGPAMRGEVSY